MASSSLCVDDLTAEPPAHCRLVSGHDPFETVALPHCTVRASDDLGEGSGERVFLPGAIAATFFLVPTHGTGPPSR